MSRELIRDGQVRLGAAGAVEFTLHRVVRRRHVHLHVDEDGRLHVRAPWRCSLDEARAVVTEHEAWVRESIERARRTARRRPVLRSGTELPLLDERLRLDVRPQAQIGLFDEPDGGGLVADDPLRVAHGWAARRGRSLTVRPAGVSQSHVRALLESWFRREAGRRLPERLRQLAAGLGLSPTRITVRSQRTLWGSCTARGSISLNWRLVLLPSRLADYVLVHEICHLRHLDHSKRFWGLVAQAVPDHAECRSRIRELQAELVL